MPVGLQTGGSLCACGRLVENGSRLGFGWACDCSGGFIGIGLTGNSLWHSLTVMKKTDLAKAITAFCFRNTKAIESIHAGVSPVSNTGDYSDVFIVDAEGNRIPWNEASRITQAEMKALMQTAVNRVYAVLEHEGDAEFEEKVVNYSLSFTRGWDEPEK